MKKVILILGFVLLGLVGYSQATAVADFRIADATTAFGKNLPIGTKVYNIGTGDYWVATAGVASASTLTTASGSFTQLNATGGSESTTVSDTAEIDLTLTGDDITADIITGSIDVLKLDAGVQTSLGLADTALQSEVDGSITNELQTISNTSNATTHTATLSDSGGSLQLAEGTGITLTTSETGLDGIVTIASTGEANLTMITEDFEEDDGTATAHALAQTAVTAQSARVALNGSTLKPADYTFTATTITIGVPVTQYDQVVITYSY